MPSGEEVEIAGPEDFAFLVALLVAPRTLIFLLFFFTKLPSSFENLAAANLPETSR
jgi:hypothetical protein